MRLPAPGKFISALATLILIAIVCQTALTRQSVLPNPVLYMTGQELYTADGKQFIRCKYMVENFNAYPNELFAAAPDLPPCGKNTKSACT